MSLISLVDNSRTDKNTVHAYLDLYQKLLENKKNSKIYGFLKIKISLVK